MEIKIVQDIYKTHFYEEEPINLYGLIFELTKDDGSKELITTDDCIFYTNDDLTTCGEKTLQFYPNEEEMAKNNGVIIKVIIEPKVPEISLLAVCTTIVQKGNCSSCSTSVSADCTSCKASLSSTCSSICGLSGHYGCTNCATSNSSSSCSGCGNSGHSSCISCPSSGYSACSGCWNSGHTSCSVSCGLSGHTSCSNSCGNSGHSSCGNCPSSGTNATSKDRNIIYETSDNLNRVEVLNLSSLNYNDTTYSIGQIVYKSNNNSKNSSTAGMSSTAINLTGAGTLTFKWMCNAESYDKGRMEVWKDGVEQTSLEKTISGSNGSTSFISVSVNLPSAGSYQVRFYFIKDSSNSYASDSLFVKDIYINNILLTFAECGEAYSFDILIRKL